jgi:hypothetical protein
MQYLPVRHLGGTGGRVSRAQNKRREIVAPCLVMAPESHFPMQREVFLYYPDL